MNEDQLDTSWAHPLIQEMQSETCPARKSMFSIPIHFVFVNGQNEITSITKEIHDLEESKEGSFLSENTVLEIIQKKRCLEDKNIRYAFESMKSFVVSMEPQFLNDFIQQPNNYIESNTFRIPQKVVFPDSVFLFHQSNCLWMFFQEMERVLPPPSILKQCSKKSKYTKKVRISNFLPSRYGSRNKTKRQF